jgi:glycosyltransferase involved in cell wall biosynthesis
LLRDLGIELTLGGPKALELHDVWRDSGFEALDIDLPVERNVRKGDRPSVLGLLREGAGIPEVALRIARAARVGSFDAIWANGHWTHMDAAFAGRHCGVPTILHLHEEAMPGIGTWLRTGAVRIAARTVAVSNAVAAGLPRSTRKRVEVITNGVDTDKLSPTSDRESADTLRASFGVAVDDVMVLAATRLDPCKRIEDLVEAVSSVSDPRLKLVVAGVTSAFPEYERDVLAAAQRKAGSQILFCGNRDDIVDLLRASDLLLHAGMVEGMPLGVLEAQACGVPVVAYAVAGVPEVVGHGVTGLLAEAGVVEDLARCLQTAVLDANLRCRMSTAARRNTVVHHGIRRQARQNAALIRDVCGTNGRR